MPAITELCARTSRLAARHHRIVTRSQLHHIGISEKQIHLWQGTGFLARVEPNVFLVAGGELTWAARLFSVCADSGAIASHRSAAALHGLEGCHPGRPEISLPSGVWFRREGVRTHLSTDLHLITPVTRDAVPTTPVARTVLDLGAVAPYLVEDAARDAVGKRLTTWDGLLTTLVSHSRKGRRGCGPLRAVLDLHYGDKTESSLERQFLRLIRAAGLPVPDQQVVVTDEHGFIMRLDFAYAARQIAIEIDSVLHHANDRAFELDRIKRNRLRIAGWLLLEITGRRIRNRPTAVCEEVAAAIRAQTGVLL
jgi:very-short-patch-repair endonuclease